MRKRIKLLGCRASRPSPTVMMKDVRSTHLTAIHLKENQQQRPRNFPMVAPNSHNNSHPPHSGANIPTSFRCNIKSTKHILPAFDCTKVSADSTPPPTQSTDSAVQVPTPVMPSSLEYNFSLSQDRHTHLQPCSQHSHRSPKNTQILARISIHTSKPAANSAD